MLGVDFAGTIKYQVERKKEKKAYLALFACSLTRAVDLDLGRSLEDLIMCFKKFIYCEKRETRTSLFRQWNDNQGSGKVVTEGEKA